MTCSCTKKLPGAVDAPHLIRPDEPCLFCAEKHISAAMQLANECGYETPNRQKIIGELVLAQWHVYRTHYPLAEKLRDIRHLVQSREESKIGSSWSDVCTEIDMLIQNQLQDKK